MKIIGKLDVYYINLLVNVHKFMVLGSTVFGITAKLQNFTFVFQNEGKLHMRFELKFNDIIIISCKRMHKMTFSSSAAWRNCKKTVTF